MALLEVKNIETYYGPILAIKGISLEVAERDIVTIAGKLRPKTRQITNTIHDNLLNIFFLPCYALIIPTSKHEPLETNLFSLPVTYIQYPLSWIYVYVF